MAFKDIFKKSQIPPGPKDTDIHEKEEQGQAFIQDDLGAVAPLYVESAVRGALASVQPTGNVRVHQDGFVIADFEPDQQQAALQKTVTGGGGFAHPIPTVPPGGFVQMPAGQEAVMRLMQERGITQAEASKLVFNPVPAAEVIVGNEIVRMRQDLSIVLARVSAHENNLANLNTALGEFRTKVMAPIKEELSFLRYNLGDKANTTVSQMQGVLTHLHKMFEAIAKMGGMDAGQIKQLRADLGIPENIPSLEDLEKTGRPFVEFEAMQAAQDAMVRQNERLLAALENQEKQISALRQYLTDAQRERDDLSALLNAATQPGKTK